MRYRPFGKTGLDVSTLSLGCMRFPSDEAATQIVTRAYELGINYIEMSIGYNDSEARVQRALASLGKDARSRLLLSTKCAPSKPEDQTTAEHARRSLETSLGRLKTDHVDFYHAWCVMDEDNYELTVRGGWLDAIRKARDEGLVRHIGITTHATPRVVEQIIDEGLFEVLTIQYSLVLQSYREVIARAREKGMAVVLMGPLGGGLLGLPSPVLKQVFAPDDQVAGALKYVLCDPAVSTAASGMESAREVEENCAVIDALPDDLDMTYQSHVNGRIREFLGDRLDEFERLLCGGCRYCTNVCPEGVRAFAVFQPYNAAMLGVQPKDAAKLAEQAQELREKCTECGKCLEVCPQHIQVPEHLERVRDFFKGERDP